MSDQNALGIAKVVRTRTVFLILSAISLLVLGLVYAWSIFAVPLSEAYGWDRSLLSYVFSISMTSFCIGCLIGAFIEKRTSIAVALIIAAVLQVSGFVLTSLMAANGVWTLYLFYGVFAGFGCGVAYNTIISTVNLWFPDRIGLASGVMMMGFGMGSLILGTVANIAIGAFGWSLTFIAIGLISACVLVCMAFLLRRPPSDIEETVGRQTKKKISDIVVETKAMAKTPLFWIYSIWMFIVFGSIMTLVGDSKQGALVLGVDPEMATLLVGFVSMMNGTARVVLGIVYDKTNLRVPMLITMFSCLLGIGLIALAFMFTLPTLYYGAALLVGFAAGGIPILASSFSREKFGAADYPRNLATVNLNVAPAALLSSVVVGIARPLGGDVAIYLILFVLLVVALLDLLFFQKLYYRKSSLSEESAQ
ncbi:MAG: MFS transporter [Raoultibacter sp.]|jgi:OFA family oxalate/formate antiporter-like MFS transporter